MGKRGPAPAPTALKLLRGEVKADRLNREEPKAPPGSPPMADWLGARAAEHWARLEPDLLAMGVLARTDDGTLAAYCSALAMFEQAESQLNELGYVKGRRLSPWLAVKKQALDQLAKFGGLLGLSASARSSIHVKPPGTKEAENPFSQFGS